MPPTPPITSRTKNTWTAVCMLLTGVLIHVIFEATGGFFSDLTSQLAPLFGGLTALCVLLVGLLQGYWKKWHPFLTVLYLSVFGAVYTFIYWILPHASYLIFFVPVLSLIPQILLELVLCGDRGSILLTSLAFMIAATSLDGIWLSMHHPNVLLWTDFLPSTFAMYPALSLQFSFYIATQDKTPTEPPAPSGHP